LDIARQRLQTQHITGPGFATPADVVKWFGAVQAQDYPGALWALGLRTTGAVESDIEQAIADRTIVRTWPLRGTMHFVAPADVRWMLNFFAPRTIARAAPRFKQLELDDGVLARGANLIVKALEGGRQMSRPRIYALFQGAGIATAENRGIHILWRCAHDGLICFGAHDGRQPTFALLEEWVPRARAFNRDEALAELARRYFTSHGPATLADFAWWSGLAAADARSALEMARLHLRRTTVDAVTYWLAASASSGNARSPRAVLLPPYDEYTVAYRDRSAALDTKHAVEARNGIFSPTILLDGRIVGTWTRAKTANDVKVSTRLFGRLDASKAGTLADAVERYRAFTRPE
jgi:hypothetical protein